jgi:hypothetical protein
LQFRPVFAPNQAAAILATTLYVEIGSFTKFPEPAFCTEAPVSMKNACKFGPTSTMPTAATMAMNAAKNAYSTATAPNLLVAKRQKINEIAAFTFMTRSFTRDQSNTNLFRFSFVK